MMETPTSHTCLELDEHAGSSFSPKLIFSPISPHVESNFIDPPYLLPVINDDALNCSQEVMLYELLNIYLICKLYKTDVRNMCRDITFPFDRG